MMASSSTKRSDGPGVVWHVSPYVAVALVTLACAVMGTVPVVWSGKPDGAPASRTATAQIQLATIDTEYCPRLEFDNDTGEMRHKGLQPCTLTPRKAREGKLRGGFGR